mmetsp:Transcript_21989/g.32673  ORF Transcript_21989/g.32673 Transcript_21989/m.32673 type:complete len:85 (-) Transcript_21989:46-300(-)
MPQNNRNTNAQHLFLKRLYANFMQLNKSFQNLAEKPSNSAWILPHEKKTLIQFLLRFFLNTFLYILSPLLFPWRFLITENTISP